MSGPADPNGDARALRAAIEASCTGPALLRGPLRRDVREGLVVPPWKERAWPLLGTLVLLFGAGGLSGLVVLPGALKLIVAGVILGMALGVWLLYWRSERGAGALRLLEAGENGIASPHHGWAVAKDRFDGVFLCRMGSRTTGAGMRTYRVLSVVARDTSGVWYPVCATSGPQRFLVERVGAFGAAHGLTVREIEPGHQAWPSGGFFKRFLPVLWGR